MKSLVTTRSNAPSPSRIPSRFLISPFECICAHNVTGSTFRSERIPPPSTMQRSSLAYWNSCTKLIAPNSRFASHGISNRSDQHFSFNFAPHNHAIRIQLSSKLHGTNGWWRLRWRWLVGGCNWELFAVPCTTPLHSTSLNPRLYLD